jgi:hypothetical protein
MNIEGYSLLQNSEFDIQYSTCPLMPHADKDCIHRELIIAIIKQHKPSVNCVALTPLFYSTIAW